MLPLSSAFLCLPWCICSCSTLVAGEPNPMRPRADLRALPQALGCVETPSRHSGCCGDSTWVSRSTDGQCFSPLGHKAAFQASKREAGPRVCPSFLLLHQGPRFFWDLFSPPHCPASASTSLLSPGTRVCWGRGINRV